MSLHQFTSLEAFSLTHDMLVSYNDFEQRIHNFTKYCIRPLVAIATPLTVLIDTVAHTGLALIKALPALFIGTPWSVVAAVFHLKTPIPDITITSFMVHLCISFEGLVRFFVVPFVVVLHPMQAEALVHHSVRNTQRRKTAAAVMVRETAPPPSDTGAQNLTRMMEAQRVELERITENRDELRRQLAVAQSTIQMERESQGQQARNAGHRQGEIWDLEGLLEQTRRELETAQGDLHYAEQHALRQDQTIQEQRNEIERLSQELRALKPE